jgi:hypothetical protein
MILTPTRRSGALTSHLDAPIGEADGLTTHPPIPTLAAITSGSSVQDGAANLVPQQPGVTDKRCEAPNDRVEAPDDQCYEKQGPEEPNQPRARVRQEQVHRPCLIVTFGRTRRFKRLAWT